MTRFPWQLCPQAQKIVVLLKFQTEAVLLIGRLDRAEAFAYTPLLARAEARVAQLVEQATENRRVGGSNPPPGTIPC